MDNFCGPKQEVSLIMLVHIVMMAKLIKLYLQGVKMWSYSILKEQFENISQFFTLDTIFHKEA